MSLSVESRRIIYNGNDVTVAFSIPFSFQSNTSYVGAKLWVSDDDITDLVYTTDFTISSTTLTMVVAPATGEKLIIYSKVPLSQTEDYADETPFLPSNFENGLDKLAQQLQQLDEAVKRAPKFNMKTSLSNVEMPSTITAEATLVANAAGDGLEWGPTVSSIEADVAAAAASASAAASSASSASTHASSASSSASSASSSASAASASAAAAAASAALFSDGDKGDVVVSGSGTVWSVADMTGDSGAGGVEGLVPAPAAGDAAANKFLKADGTWATAGVADHGALTGLTDDDHTQYALLAGRSGGQTIIGGTASGDDLTIKSTSNATKGSIFLGSGSGYTLATLDDATGRIGFGTTSPTAYIDIVNGSGGSDDYGHTLRFTNGATQWMWYLSPAGTMSASVVGSSGSGWSSSTAGRFAISNGAIGHPNSAFNVKSTNNGDDSIAVVKKSGQTASAFTYYDTDESTVLARIDVSGNATFASITGTIALSVSTKTAGYTLTSADDVIIFNSSSDATLTLHSAATATKKNYQIKNIGTGNITIARAGSDTIDGDTSYYLAAGVAPFPAVSLVPDGGTAWYVF